MLMTVNIKLSIIVIAEIILSTDDTCLHVYMSTSKHFSSKWTEQSELYLDWRDSIQYARKRESIASILPVVSTIIACNRML